MDNSLTHSVEEADFDEIFGENSIFRIPYFQREYKWGKHQFTLLSNDIMDILNKTEDIHFLGNLLLYSSPKVPGRARIYDVVDGQQRITTLYLFLAALAKQYCLINKYDDASNLFMSYLALHKKTKEKSNLKLYPCREDRSQFNATIEDLLSDEQFKAAIDMKVMLLPNSGPLTGKITGQYKEIKLFLENEEKKGGYKRLNKIYGLLLSRLTVVQILIKDLLACPKIFESLNYKGLQVTVGDLVRNEIFAKAAMLEPAVVDDIYLNKWIPFYEKFGNPKEELFDKYFFPFGLIEKPEVTKSAVFTLLRTKWQKTSDPAKVIEELGKYQDAFLDLTTGSKLLDLSKPLSLSLKKLREAKYPSAIYPFLMQLCNALRDGKIKEKDGQIILAILDSFLTRRAVCGFEPTGLHAVFKKLWTECEGKPTPARIEEKIRSRRTVPWPNDEQFSKCIKERPLYRAGIINYLIKEYDRGLGCDVPADEPWVEHVLPQKQTSGWKKYFDSEAHDGLVDTWANLIPLSPPMNRSVGQDLYEKKRKRYKNDAMYATPRDFAKKYSIWTPQKLDSRAKELAIWAKKRWPY